jgi:hypothetical protein
LLAEQGELPAGELQDTSHGEVMTASVHFELHLDGTIGVAWELLTDRGLLSDWLGRLFHPSPDSSAAPPRRLA